jgi:hypothetical protein
MTNDIRVLRDVETKTASTDPVKEDFKQLKEASRALRARASELKSKSERLVEDSSFLLGTPPLTQEVLDQSQ